VVNGWVQQEHPPPLSEQRKVQLGAVQCAAGGADHPGSVSVTISGAFSRYIDLGSLNQNRPALKLRARIDKAHRLAYNLPN